jgi:hypothetical protein
MRKTSPVDWLINWSARGVLLSLLVFALVFTQGCSGVSEEDLNNLKRENEALANELEQERHQAEVLNRALTNVYKERDRLVDLLNTPSEEVAQENDQAAAGSTPPVTQASGAAATGEGTQAATSEIYLVQIGDTLSTIAQRHETTMAVLLSLNPYLMQRNNYMVWENDRIVLPR